MEIRNQFWLGCKPCLLSLSNQPLCRHTKISIDKHLVSQRAIIFTQSTKNEPTKHFFCHKVSIINLGRIAKAINLTRWCGTVFIVSFWAQSVLLENLIENEIVFSISAFSKTLIEATEVLWILINRLILIMRRSEIQYSPHKACFKTQRKCFVGTLLKECRISEMPCPTVFSPNDLAFLFRGGRTQAQDNMTHLMTNRLTRHLRQDPSSVLYWIHICVEGCRCFSFGCIVPTCWPETASWGTHWRGHFSHSISDSPPELNVLAVSKTQDRGYGAIYLF